MGENGSSPLANDVMGTCPATAAAWTSCSLLAPTTGRIKSGTVAEAMTRTNVNPAGENGAADQVLASGREEFDVIGLANSVRTVVAAPEAVKVAVPMFHWFLVFPITAFRAGVKSAPFNAIAADSAAVSANVWVSFFVM